MAAGLGVLLALGGAASPAGASPRTITTVAGNGSAGYSGDGGPATSASLNAPAGVAVDASGDIFISDDTNNRIRKVNPSGVITTVAGTGSAGYSGDGGPATSAQLRGPTDVVVDSAGNLYVADAGNSRVRKVSSSGTITTVAGNGGSGYSGDGGPATSAALASPVGVSLDTGGNLYIADFGNNTVRKVNPSGTISTLAGTGSSGYSGDGGPGTSAKLNTPTSVSAGAGAVYIADAGNARVRAVGAYGVITTVAGTGSAGYSGDGGPATSAQLEYPVGLAVDSSGDLFIADFFANVVRQVSPSGTITTVAGTGSAGYSGDGGPATSAQLRNPARVDLDRAGNFYISDFGNNRVRQVQALGTPATVPGAPTGVSATAGDSQATVTWSPPASNGGSPITSYTVTSSGGQVVTVSGLTTSATVGGLRDGTAYMFTVAATNAVGTGPPSARSGAVTPMGRSGSGPGPGGTGPGPGGGTGSGPGGTRSGPGGYGSGVSGSGTNSTAGTVPGAGPGSVGVASPMERHTVAPRPAGARSGPAPAAPAPQPAPVATRVLHQLGKASLTLSEGSAASVVLLLLLVAFLTVQDRIDRNDPKLALAPVYGEPDLGFGPPPDPGEVVL